MTHRARHRAGEIVKVFVTIELSDMNELLCAGRSVRPSQVSTGLAEDDLRRSARTTQERSQEPGRRQVMNAPYQNVMLNETL